MGKVIAWMTMSPAASSPIRRAMSIGLYADFAALQGSLSMTATIAETGAVLRGRTTFAMGDPDVYVGDYEFQVPECSSS